MESFVLIAGGGPIGLSASIDLSWRGVPHILVTENTDTATHPKCNTTNTRSMEHFRRLGIARQLRSEALPAELERASAYVTRYCGFEFGRLPRAYADWPTPEVPATISQIVLERTLRRIAEDKPSAQIIFGWKLLSFVADDGGVTAEIADVASGQQRTVRARFLIGADGASSTVRRALGLRMVGEDGAVPRAFMGGTMLSYFIRAPGLNEASGRRPSHMTWVINPQMRAMFYAQDGREKWVVHYQVPAGMEWQSVNPEKMIRDAIGNEKVAFEILSGGPWTGGLALVAEHYQSGPVFLAGDAAHLFTPLGGLGMNTGIGDVMNLTWKLAAVYDGWGGSHLLASYEPERRPVGARNSQLGVRCAAVMDGWRTPPDFEDDTPAAAAMRSALGARAIIEDKPQYRTVGLQLDERYENSPVIVPDGSPSPPSDAENYVPLDRPGARAPHLWLGKDSLFDAFGKGFTLLDFGATDGSAALSDAAKQRGLPLKILSVDSADESPYRSKLVIVRPDQHIAWHGDGVADALGVIDRVRGVYA